ncbi:MAG: heme-binding domain-containing protein [Thermaceae bacterium]|nr:heme-binding domain-containing protein [Thermaceae bacterium]
MKRFVLNLVVGLAALLVILQLIPYGRAHTNPPVLATPTWDSPQTQALFERACADCHSNQTTWPWYANVAPVSWLVQRDVDQGRAKLNVSEWGQGKQETEEIRKVVENGEMPPRIYLLTHPEARLSAQEKTALVEGLLASLGGAGSGEREEGHSP